MTSLPTVELGSIIKAHYGKALKKGNRNELGDYSVYGSSGVLGCHDHALTTEDTLVVGRKGSVGEVIWASSGGWVIDTAYFIERHDPDSVDLRYLYYAMKRANLANKTITTSIPGLNRDDLYAAKIPLPSLKEQKRIAAILDKADSLRRKRQQAIQLADQFLRAVFLDMFGDPVTNPKGWDFVPIKSGVVSVTSGWSAKGHDQPCEKGEVGVLKISSVTSGHFNPGENKMVPHELIPPNKKLVFPVKGDLLFSRANTRELVAATCIVEDNHKNVFLPDKLWRISLDQERVLPEFMHYLIQQPKFRSVLTSQATGTSGSMLNISKSKFEATEAIFPEISQQRHFRDIYWKVRNLVKFEKTSELNLNFTFKSLSQKAFAGEL